MVPWCMSSQGMLVGYFGVVLILAVNIKRPNLSLYHNYMVKPWNICKSIYDLFNICIPGNIFWNIFRNFDWFWPLENRVEESFLDNRRKYFLCILHSLWYFCFAHGWRRQNFWSEPVNFLITSEGDYYVTCWTYIFEVTEYILQWLLQELALTVEHDAVLSEVGGHCCGVIQSDPWPTMVIKSNTTSTISPLEKLN